VWRFAKNGIRIEKRVMMPNLQNTTYLVYRSWKGLPGSCCASGHRSTSVPHEGCWPRASSVTWNVMSPAAREIEIGDGGAWPRSSCASSATVRSSTTCGRSKHVLYRIEKSRGYEYEGPLWSPGVIRIAMALTRRGPSCVGGSMGRGEGTLLPRSVERGSARRKRLLEIAGTPGRDPECGSWCWPPISSSSIRIPAWRMKRGCGHGRRAGTVIAGYHWFTDWGREHDDRPGGTGARHRPLARGGNILRTFASYIRDGLIPNLFPEGSTPGSITRATPRCGSSTLSGATGR